MERAERNGLAVAAAGHFVLFGVLSLGLLSTSKPLPPVNDPIDVQLVDAVGLRAAAPRISAETPAPAKAPEAGPPEEAAPAPEPTLPAPEPKPAPPVPQPEPKPAPPAPAPKPAPKRSPKPKPAPEPAPARPTVAAKPAAALKTAAPAKPAAAPTKTAAAKPGAGTKNRSAAALASDDFLKGITPEKSKGKAQAPRAAQINQLAMNGLGAAIKRQIQPCYDLGSLGGTPAMSIVTVLRLRFNPDGSVIGSPTVSEQTGITGQNQAYAKQMADVSRRAVLRCAPLKLPAELYKGGWDDIDLGFIPSQLN